MIRLAAAALAVAFLAGSAEAANPIIQPQLLPLPGTPPIPPPPAPPPAPLPPPINPGFAPAPPNGLSPILTQPGPVYELPRAAAPSYPALPLPGPIDEQKIEAYRNDLRAQQWLMQSQGVSPANQRAREVQQQLNAPDPQ